MIFLSLLLDCFLIVIPITFAVGAYFCYRLRFLSFRAIPLALRLSIQKNTTNSKITSFSALASVLGGNLGVGNISGMAMALSLGGPGAIFWMWVMALFGSMVKFSSCLLGVLYQRQNAKGDYVGGPMYYIQEGAKSPFFAIVFCLLTMLSALTVGNLVQVNSFALSLAPYCHPLGAGCLLFIIVGYILIGGAKRFAQVSSYLVPIMAIIYLVMCLIVLARFSQNILPAFLLIFKSALTFEAGVGGISGYAVLHVMQVGFNRGLFATDAGAGLEAIIHGSVKGSQSTPQEAALAQALVASVAPFLVVALCTITALVLLVTDVWQDPLLKSTSMCIAAFQVGLGSAYTDIFLAVIIFFFALTTILTWSFCFERTLEFLVGRTYRWGKLAFLLFIPLGTLLKVDMIWLLGDLSFNAMLLVNVLFVAKLSHEVIQVARPLISRKKLNLFLAESKAPS